MSRRINRRKVLKYGSAGVASLAMSGTGFAKGTATNGGPTIKGTEVVHENKNYRFRKTVVSGTLYVSKFDKRTGAVGITVAGSPEAVNVIESKTACRSRATIQASTRQLPPTRQLLKHLSSTNFRLKTSAT